MQKLSSKHLQDMLCKHNCEGAFWMGNLKNRDLQGNEIFSQSQSIANVDNQNICAPTEVVHIKNCVFSNCYNYDVVYR